MTSNPVPLGIFQTVIIFWDVMPSRLRVANHDQKMDYFETLKFRCFVQELETKLPEGPVEVSAEQVRFVEWRGVYICVYLYTVYIHIYVYLHDIHKYPAGP